MNNCFILFSQPFDYGRKHVWRNSLLHFSRWLVGVIDHTSIKELEVSTNIPFDNVAVLHFTTQDMDKLQDSESVLVIFSQLLRMSSIRNDLGECVTEILLIKAFLFCFVYSIIFYIVYVLFLIIVLVYFSFFDYLLG